MEMSEEKFQNLFCILEREQENLLSFIRLLLANNVQDAQDVLQKTNERIMRAADKVDLSKDVPAYFRKIALREVQRNFRDHNRARVVFDTERMDSLLERIAEDVEDEELFHGKELEHYLQALRHCVGKENSTSRAMLEERYFRNKKNSQIAKEHMLSRASVALFLFRIRQSLRKCIENFLKHPQKPTPFAQDVSLLLDGELPQEREEALIQRIITDAHCRREYIEFAMLHSALTGITSPIRVKKTTRLFRAAAAIVLCTLTAFGIILAVPTKKTLPPVPTQQTQTEQGKETQMTTPRLMATAITVATTALAITHSERSNAIALDTRNSTPAQAASSIDSRNKASDTSKPNKLNTTKPIGTIISIK